MGAPITAPAHFPEILWSNWYPESPDVRLNAFIEKNAIGLGVESTMKNFQNLTDLFLRVARLKYGRDMEGPMKRTVKPLVWEEASEWHLRLAKAKETFDLRTKAACVAAPLPFQRTGFRISQALEHMRIVAFELFLKAPRPFTRVRYQCWLAQLPTTRHGKTQGALKELAARIKDMGDEDRCLEIARAVLSKLILRDLGLAGKLAL